MERIDKQSMINDIILTIALVLSLFISDVIIHIINIHENEFLIFSILSFVFIKAFYNIIIHILRKLKKV